jgi:hypothetical protein
LVDPEFRSRTNRATLEKKSNKDKKRMTSEEKRKPAPLKKKELQ